MRMSREEYLAYLSRTKNNMVELMGIKTTNKYHAIKTQIDNIVFDSKAECDYYKFLKTQMRLGEVSYFLRQVPIHLAGGVRLIIDFLVFYKNGNQEYVDVKGYQPTEAWRVKQRIAEAEYPIKIKIVKKREIQRMLRFHMIE